MSPHESPVTGASAHPAQEVFPRPAVGRLPKYSAGKPPRVLDGLTSYKLSSNEVALAPLPEVREAVAGFDAFNRYPDPLVSGLRARISQEFGVPADDVVTGAGSLGALIQIISAFAGQNEDGSQDEVLYAWRSFEAYPICVGLAGARSVQIPLLADGRHDLAAMAAAVTENTRIILLCTPNNPTGPVLRTQETHDFLARIPENVLVVIDEAYVEFVRDPDAVKGLEFLERYPNVVVLRTFSKAHGLAGLRVGYSVSHPEITQYLRLSATPFAVSQVAEHAAIASLDHLPQVMERVESVVQERERVVSALATQGWELPQAQGNFVWLPLGDRSAEFAELAGTHGLSVRAFHPEGVRVSIGEPEANTRFIGLCESFIAS
ncbi:MULTISPECIES: histidinol-phosphate transaminase [Arthrobacter]|uniref:Aromatic amino acid aminotransferase n=2 Tax=Arthrobacter TaxID=1663 RepID=A0ABU9KJ59_9MICC|nr:histidinol-phosphate transaminase [Arthrobacter sp. YJM1]MDP5226817.1 histidinol-phosphate transaminase [Arthrobacter sp. YJM1]